MRGNKRTVHQKFDNLKKKLFLNRFAAFHDALICIAGNIQHRYI